MSLSVDPNAIEDEHYRYKMPPVLIKPEGSGNGVKTVFPNIKEVCKAIDRPAKALIKYFGVELGAHSIVIDKDDKYLVMGTHTKEKVQETVYKFITKYVLCRKCRNPETIVVVEHNKYALHCKSCGERVTMDPSDRFLNTLAQLYREDAVKGGKGGKVKGAKGQAETETTAAPPPAAITAPPPSAATPSSAAVHVDPATTQKAPETTEVAKPVEKENPIKVLSNLIHSGSASFDTVVSSVYRLRTDHGLPDGYATRLAFRGVIFESEKAPPPKFIGALQKQVPLLLRFADSGENQRTIIHELLLFCQKHNLIEKVPMAMKMFFEEGIVSEVELVDWYDKKSEKHFKNVKPDFAEKVREISKPFIQWLQPKKPTEIPPQTAEPKPSQ